MDITQLPFNQLIGLQYSKEDDFQVYLPDDPKYTNHLGTVHASAMLSVAEAGSGAFLSQQFTEYANVMPVVRRLEAKFRKPGNGQISVRCLVAEDVVADWKNELSTRGRMSATIPVEVVDSSGNVVMSATVEWFITHSKA